MMSTRHLVNAISRGCMRLILAGLLLLGGAFPGVTGQAWGNSGGATAPASPEPKKESPPSGDQSEPKKPPETKKNGDKKKRAKKSTTNRFGGGTIRGVPKPDDKKE